VRVTCYSAVVDASKLRAATLRSASRELIATSQRLIAGSRELIKVCDPPKLIQSDRLLDS
jgi:hypothetical protein